MKVPCEDCGRWAIWVYQGHGLRRWLCLACLANRRLDAQSWVPARYTRR